MKINPHTLGDSGLTVMLELASRAPADELAYSGEHTSIQQCADALGISSGEYTANAGHYFKTLMARERIAWAKAMIDEYNRSEQ